jgi:hypothetical protein
MSRDQAGGGGYSLIGGTDGDVAMPESGARGRQQSVYWLKIPHLIYETAGPAEIA